MKATGFKSLLINCWNITQVIWIYKIFSSTLTSYYIQSHLLKNKCIKPPPLMLSDEFFKTAEAATPEVFRKIGVLKNFTICISFFIELR